MKKILVIDDEFEVRESIKNMLADVGVETVGVSDAISALLTLKDHSDIDIVITDYRLPGLSGKDWIDIIRHYHPEKKVIVITAYDVAKEKVPDKVKVLMKPFNKSQLLEVLRL